MASLRWRRGASASTEGVALTHTAQPMPWTTALVMSTAGLQPGAAAVADAPPDGATGVVGADGGREQGGHGPVVVSRSSAMGAVNNEGTGIYPAAELAERYENAAAALSSRWAGTRPSKP